MAGPISDQSLRRFYSSAVCGKLAVSDVDDVRKIWVGQRFSDTDRTAHTASSLGSKRDLCTAASLVTMPSIFMEINPVGSNTAEYNKI